MNSYKETDTLLKLQDISLKFGENQILHGINLEVKDVIRPNFEQGQVVAIVGRSGLGKTQLFKIIAGLQKPTTGTVLVGVDQHPVCAGEVGIIPQNYILFNHRTVYDNLKIGLVHSGKKLNEKECENIITEYATKFDIQDHLKKYATQLSGGQKQRVSILQQVLADNKFILMDEPFSGLDIFVMDKVIDLILKISTMNELNTLVIVSHDIPTAMLLSDQVWVMARQEGTPGATIVKTVDMKSMGLAWQPHLRENKRFLDLIEDVKKVM
jgi:ABC-type nitrate/sulfonate/bicarbonate transport system ATPase subunit